MCWFTFTGSKSSHFHLSLFYHSFHSSNWRNSKPPILITNTLSSIHTIETLLSFPHFHLNRLCPKEWTHHWAREDLSIISSNEHYTHLHTSSIHLFPLFNPLSINPTPSNSHLHKLASIGNHNPSSQLLSHTHPSPITRYLFIDTPSSSSNPLIPVTPTLFTLLQQTRAIPINYILCPFTGVFSVFTSNTAKMVSTVAVNTHHPSAFSHQHHFLSENVYQLFEWLDSHSPLYK